MQVSWSIKFPGFRDRRSHDPLTGETQLFSKPKGSVMLQSTLPPSWHTVWNRSVPSAMLRDGRQPSSEKSWRSVRITACAKALILRLEQHPTAERQLLAPHREGLTGSQRFQHVFAATCELAEEPQLQRLAQLRVSPTPSSTGRCLQGNPCHQVEPIAKTTSLAASLFRECLSAGKSEGRFRAPGAN